VVEVAQEGGAVGVGGDAGDEFAAEGGGGGAGEVAFSPPLFSAAPAASAASISSLFFCFAFNLGDNENKGV
jgi:hypothetical protein